MLHPSRLTPLAALALAATLHGPGPSAGQEHARTRVEENFRRVPNGEVLGRLEAGVDLVVVDRRGQWLQVDLEGWMWTRSLHITERSGFDVVVTEPEGENLRSAPSGEILGRLARGTLLDEVERVPGWIRVRRRGWLWAPSVEESTEPPREVPAASARPSSPAVSSPSRFLPTPGSGASILAAPDGDTLGRVLPGSALEMMAREGNWVRVRLEGWVWLPAKPGQGDEASPVVELTPEDLARDPDAFRGSVVSWDVQFISLERAEAVRTDFFEGEPFLLARYGGVGGPFVYLAVPPDRVGEMEGLVPLERLLVTGRIRTGASVLTGTPIVDLLSLSRTREER